MSGSRRKTDRRTLIHIRQRIHCGRHVVLILTLSIVFCQACPGNSIVFRDVTKETGITFRHTDGSSGKRYIMETVAGGLALFDYDNDGDVDIYFLNGAPLKGAKFDVPPKNVLYRNEGNWKFTDVTKQARVGDMGYGLGVAAGDYDNDGDLDIYINNHGPNVLYRNDGNGRFSDVTEQANVDDERWSAGAAFVDYDHDGDLDLYVSNYAKFKLAKNKHCKNTAVTRDDPAQKIYDGPCIYLVYCHFSCTDRQCQTQC